MRQAKVQKILLLLLVTVLLTACTAQSTPLGERAVVRLLYLEKVNGGYEALTVVCDFTPQTDPSQADSVGLVQLQKGKTVEQAVRASVGEREGKPFFAQNQLLILGSGLAGGELTQTLNYFAENCGTYRDMTVWLWDKKTDDLFGMENALEFAQELETMAARDELGCVYHVLDYSGEQTSVVLPILTSAQTSDGNGVVPQIAGLGIFEKGAQRRCTDIAEIQAFGLLRGRIKTMELLVADTGKNYTVQLENISRKVTSDNSKKLKLSFEATAISAEKASDTLQQKIRQELEVRCQKVLQKFPPNLYGAVYNFEWWSVQLGLDGDEVKISWKVSLEK